MPSPQWIMRAALVLMLLNSAGIAAVLIMLWLL
jgi:hypothetical protein